MTTLLYYNHIQDTWSYDKGQGLQPFATSEEIITDLGLDGVDVMLSAIGNEGDCWVWQLTA
jgi:hypothetical protein